MGKSTLLIAVGLAIGTTSIGSFAQAQGFNGREYRRGYVSRGPDIGPRQYRGGHGGISPGAAVGLGIAGLAAGAIAADAARRADYGYAPAYGYGTPSYAYGVPGYNYAPDYGAQPPGYDSEEESD